MQRHDRITRKRQPTKLDMVVMECALRRVVGGPKIMSPQLRYIADICTEPNVSVRILPFTAGIPHGDPMNHFTVPLI